MSNPSPVTAHRAERVLAYMIAAIVALSLICFIAIIVATAAGMQETLLAGGIWSVIAVLPMIGLPLAFVLIIVLLLVSVTRRSRAAKDVRG